MKQSIAYTIRPCRACSRPLYTARREVAPSHVPLCGTCITWSKLIRLKPEWYEQFVRVLVRGAEREGMAHRLMLRKGTQFVASFAPAPDQ